MNASTLQETHERLEGTAAQRSVFNLLTRFIQTIESSLRDGADPHRSLWNAVERHGLAVPTLRRTFPIPQSDRLADLHIAPDVLFGATVAPPTGPFPAQTARLVRYGVKPACILHGTESELAGLLGAAYRQGLVGLLSATETVLRTEKDKGGFSNLPSEVRPARPGSGALRQLVIARDERHAVLAWTAMTYGWDALLGAALGFPACCIRRFVDEWDLVVADHGGDPAELLLHQDEAAPADWRVNVLGRYLGHKILEHFPCRWRCEPSRRLAEQYEEALMEHEPQTLLRLRTRLRCPYVYTREHGVFAFPHAQTCNLQVGWRIGYSPAEIVCTFPECKLHEALLRDDVLVATPEYILVRGRRYEARTACFT